MTNDKIFKEITGRVQKSIEDHSGTLPEALAAAWDGYVMALLEWQLISPAQHEALVRIIPRPPGNPVVEIALGEPPKPTGGA